MYAASFWKVYIDFGQGHQWPNMVTTNFVLMTYITVGSQALFTRFDLSRGPV
jgi:hypothetical protein